MPLGLPTFCGSYGYVSHNLLSLLLQAHYPSGCALWMRAKRFVGYSAMKHLVSIRTIRGVTSIYSPSLAKALNGRLINGSSVILICSHYDFADLKDLRVIT